MTTARTADSWSQGESRTDRSYAASRAPRPEGRMDMDRGMSPDRTPRPPRSAPPRARAGRPDRTRAPEDDMAYRSGAADYPRPAGRRRPSTPVRGSERRRPADDHDRDHDRDHERDYDRAPSRARGRTSAPAESEGRKFRGAVAVLGVFLVTLAGAGVDSFVGVGLGLITLIALVGSTVLATLLVRRSDLVTLVVAPPLVFMAVAAVNIALAPSASFSLATIATLLIRGFPTMAIATVAAIVLALVRWAARR
jgi:hypothetical protein